MIAVLLQGEKGRDEGTDGGKRRERRGEKKMERRGGERSQGAREGKCALDCILFLLSESGSLIFQV